MTAQVDLILREFDDSHEERLRERVREIIQQSFSPPPKLKTSEWADEERYLSPEASAEPGKWLTSRVEPSRGIMDAFDEPDVETVTVMVAAQTVKTEVILNILGKAVHLDPGPALVLQPTLQMAEAFSKDRLAPMIRDTPALAGKIGNSARDSEDTILHKKYAGGHITMAGANSPASLASRPIRYLLCDEVDRYDASAGKEGDPVSLAKERTTTFWNRKIGLFSTPTIKGASRIEASWEESDQRRFFVRCPKCQNEQHFEWRPKVVAGAKIGGVRWEPGREEDARYHCSWFNEDGEVCDYGWSEAERLQAIATGRWIATRPEVKGHAGFHLNRIASPWRSVGEMAKDFVLVEKHPERLKTWINTRLAETWEERGERVDPASLLGRAEEYEADPLPSGVACVVAGVDIQDDRFEIEWMGVGAQEETWSLDYTRHYAEPTRGGFWEALDHALSRRFRHPCGLDLMVEAACIDSGYMTDQVYAFCRPRKNLKIYPIKGLAGASKPLWPPSATKNKSKNIDVFLVGVDAGKDTIYKRLVIKEPGPGFCHFPRRQPYDGTYFEGLTAEKAVIEVNRLGFPIRRWVKVHVRNEPLDCRVYALAARASLGLNIDMRLARLRAAGELARQQAPVTAKPNVEERVAEPATAAKPGRRVRSRGIAR